MMSIDPLGPVKVDATHKITLKSKALLSLLLLLEGPGPSSRKKSIQNFYFYQAFVGLSI